LLIDLAAEPELVARVEELGSVLAAAARAPCRPRDHLGAARIALVTKISAVVPVAVAAVPVSVPVLAVADLAVAAVAALPAQVACEAEVVWEVVG
jgi:hypothetical protein